MLHYEQLTVADLQNLPSEINLAALCRRAGLPDNTIAVKLARLRDGKKDKLQPDQRFALYCAAIATCREFLQTFDPTATIIVTQHEADHRIDLPITAPKGVLAIGGKEWYVIGLVRGKPEVRFQRVVNSERQKPETLPLKEFWAMVLQEFTQTATKPVKMARNGDIE